MGKSFAMVLRIPAIVTTLEDYNLTLKIMKTGPVALKEVEMEDEEDEDDAQPAEIVTPARAEKAPVDEQGDSVMEEPQTVDDDVTKAPEDVADASLPSEAEADPVPTKKTKEGEALGEFLDWPIR